MVNKTLQASRAGFEKVGECCGIPYSRKGTAMTDKNGIEPVPIAAITPATPKDVSVTLTGVAAKAEAGSFTPSLSVPLGVAARGEAGSFTSSLPAEDRYVGSTIPFPPNTGSPPAEAEGEYVAHAVEFGPGLEGGIADAGVVGGFAISPDAGELNLNGEAPDVFNAEVTVGGEGSLISCMIETRSTPTHSERLSRQVGLNRSRCLPAVRT